MEVFAGEWLNLLIRWAHMVVAIGWIGTSFYFMALDYTLLKREKMNPGVMGTSWQVHGGGFYHVEKYTVAPATLPDVLHWFKWEAYLTWLTGFGLLVVQYYLHAEAFLIDPGVMPLAPWQAIAISIASLAAGWFIYDGLCRSKVGDNTVLLAICVFALILIASVLYTKVFSGRGAFIHVGALVGTIMAVNVFGVIIPGQKKMIAQMIAGQTPDPRYGAVGKQRSIAQQLPDAAGAADDGVAALSVPVQPSAVMADRGADHHQRRADPPCAQPRRRRRRLEQLRLDLAGRGHGADRRDLRDRAAIARGQHGRRRGDRCGRAEHRHQALPDVPRQEPVASGLQGAAQERGARNASPRCAATPSKSICRPCRIGPCRWATRPA